jgi:hypothetical protein
MLPGQTLIGLPGNVAHRLCQRAVHLSTLVTRNSHLSFGFSGIGTASSNPSYSANESHLLRFSGSECFGSRGHGGFALPKCTGEWHWSAEIVDSGEFSRSTKMAVDFNWNCK